MSQNQDPIHLARQFEIIFTTHYSAVKYFAINLLKSEEDAEDIIQDVFAKLWTQPEVWLENKDIGQYIYAMTKTQLSISSNAKEWNNPIRNNYRRNI